MVKQEAFVHSVISPEDSILFPFLLLLFIVITCISAGMSMSSRPRQRRAYLMILLSWWEFCRWGEGQPRCQFKALVIDCNWWIVLKFLSLHCSISEKNKWQTVKIFGNFEPPLPHQQPQKDEEWKKIFGTSELPLQRPTLHLPCLGRESSRTPGI